MASKNSRKAAKRRAAGRKASHKPTGLILGMVAAAAAIAVWTTAAPGEAPWTTTKTKTRAETSPTTTVSTQAPVAQAVRAQLPTASHDQARGQVATLASTDLPPLPMVQFQTPRPPEVIRSVYAFAANHPEVLSYVPCFCGCENFGHGDNHDCFVANRDAEGRVTWEAHGMG